jgi:hypothetical protein
VRRIERARPGHTACACGGPWRVRVFDNVEPDPHPCPRCGTFGKRILLMDDPWPVTIIEDGVRA